MKEEWKDIPNWEGLYQTSTFGRLRSLDRYETHIVNGIEVKRFLKGKIIEGTLNKDGYLQVGLSRNGIQYTKCIHQLVALTHIPNPLNLPDVNHKDENKKNNSIENLEWCDKSYNNGYGTRTERASEKQKNRKDCSKTIFQYDLDGNFIKEWPSIMEIERQFGFYHTNISKCCSGKANNAYGFKWSYK